MDWLFKAAKLRVLSVLTKGLEQVGSFKSKGSSGAPCLDSSAFSLKDCRYGTAPKNLPRYFC